MKKKDAFELVRMADVIVVPVLPSVFDQGSTTAFLARLNELKAVRKSHKPVGVLRNRARTRASARLAQFLAEIEHADLGACPIARSTTTSLPKACRSSISRTRALPLCNRTGRPCSATSRWRAVPRSPDGGAKLRSTGPPPAWLILHDGTTCWSSAAATPGLCAAIAARESGASVLLLECAPRHYRGGNSRHTRNLRYLHDDADGIMSGPYPEEEFWDDLLRVTAGKTDERLARLTIRSSADLGRRLGARGVRFQPALGGTLHLGRTNAFFLGGGKALVNALPNRRGAGPRSPTTPRRGISRSKTAGSSQPAWR